MLPLLGGMRSHFEPSRHDAAGKVMPMQHDQSSRLGTLSHHGDIIMQATNPSKTNQIHAASYDMRFPHLCTFRMDDDHGSMR